MTDRTIPKKYADRRDFCVIAANRITQLRKFIGLEKVCSTQRIVVVLPGEEEKNITRLERFSRRVWVLGIIDVVAILSDLRCRVFALIPTKERNTFPADQSLILTHPWQRTKTCSLNDSGVTYFPKKISGLHNSNLDVFARAETIQKWSPFMHFLEVAMDARFNINTTVQSFGIADIPPYPPQIRVAYLLVQNWIGHFYTFSSYVESLELVHAVPRVVTTSVEWFRFSDELSVFAWFALIVALPLTAGTLYLLAHDSKDTVYVILFAVVQPFLGNSWGSGFLSLRGQVFFTIWLYCSVILNTSYMTTFLSQLTVPYNTYAIKSFDDLVKPGLPVRAHVHQNLAEHLEKSPFFKPLKNRTTFNLVASHKETAMT